MNLSKIILSSLATVVLSFGGIAQAEATRAGASMPVVDLAKFSRKPAKKGVELNAVGGECTRELYDAGNCVVKDTGAAVAAGGNDLLFGLGGLAAGTAIGVAAANKNNCNGRISC